MTVTGAKSLPRSLWPTTRDSSGNWTGAGGLCPLPSCIIGEDGGQQCLRYGNTWNNRDSVSLGRPMVVSGNRPALTATAGTDSWSGMIRTVSIVASAKSWGILSHIYHLYRSSHRQCPNQQNFLRRTKPWILEKCLKSTVSMFLVSKF